MLIQDTLKTTNVNSYDEKKVDRQKIDIQVKQMVARKEQERNDSESMSPKKEVKFDHANNVDQLNKRYKTLLVPKRVNLN